MDDFFKKKIESNIPREIHLFESVMCMLVSSFIPERESQKLIEQGGDYASVLFTHWYEFSEFMPPLREVKWHIMKIERYKEFFRSADKKTIQETEQVKKECTDSLLWFHDALAQSLGFIKDSVETRELFGFDGDE